MKLGTFLVDCTPPVGCPVGFGRDGETIDVRDPLFLRGFVLDDGKQRCLIASLDFCGLMNSAHDQLVGGLAEAVSTSLGNVIVHCVHQHDAPLLDFEIEEYLHCETFPRQWWKDVIERCARAAAECRRFMVQVASIGTGETRLHGYASNRRILGPDGKVAGMRFSRCADESLKEKPVGTIDPMLRTITFRDADDSDLGSMSFYATHPQVSNGRNIYSADAPGEALRILGEGSGGGFHSFFTGAGGNITAGKYSSSEDLEGNLLKFGKTLTDGISRNLAGMRWDDPAELVWKTAEFSFPSNEGKREHLLSEINDPDSSRSKQLLRAVLLSSLEYKGNAVYRFSTAKIGNASILFLPGEPFVEYQLYAQSIIPDEFLAVAGNCSDNFLYLPMAGHFSEGGYEVNDFCWCTPDIEGRMKEAILSVLSG